MGPVEYMVIEFPGNQFSGDIVPALTELTDNGTIRIIDLLFVKKDADGNVTWYELEEIGDGAAAAFENLDGEIDSLLNEEDALIAAEKLEPNSSAGIWVFEHVWATRLRDAIVASNGRVVDNARIPAPVVQAALDAVGISEE
ncbi:MAG: DUF6325 family protein [Caldilineales bacterium]